jgi:hypothetical protein
MSTFFLLFVTLARHFSWSLPLENVKLALPARLWNRPMEKKAIVAGARVLLHTKIEVK